MIQIITHHSAILSPGYIGNIEVPASNIKPPHNEVNDVNPNLLFDVLDLEMNIELNYLQHSQTIHRPFPPSRFTYKIYTIYKIYPIYKMFTLIVFR